MSAHMTPDEFRLAAHRVIDDLCDYWRTIEDRPVLCTAKPGDIAELLPAHAPEHPESWDAILGDIDRIVIPGLTHWQSPGFFAFFPANASFPAVLGDLLSTGLGVNGMLWATSPAATEIETRVLDWLAELLGLPERFRSPGGVGGGVIHGTASEAVLTALVAARHRSATLAAKGHAPHCTIYASSQAHSSIVKAAMVAGLAANPDDRTHLRLIDTDTDHAMNPAALARAMRDDVQAGRVPTFVVATVGTTSSTAVDPLMTIGPICREFGAWLHVDAAFNGSALVCPEHRWMIEGVEHADSFNMNPHKWLLTSFDCSCFWTSDRRSLTAALSVTPEYLRNAASSSGAVIDYRDWQIPLGRRFRALKLWFVIRHYGAAGLRAYIREHVRVAQEFESWIIGDDRFEIAAPRTTSLVCFRLRPVAGESIEQADARSRDLLSALNATGKVYLTHTTLPDQASRPRHTLRMAIGSTLTEERHVRAAWELIRASVP